MSLVSFTYTLLFIDFVWSVSAFVFKFDRPAAAFIHRFFNLPVWVVYLLLFCFICFQAIYNSFVFRYARTIWHREHPAFATPRLPQYFQPAPQRSISVVIPSSPRDITSATPTSAAVNRWPRTS